MGFLKNLFKKLKTQKKQSDAQPCAQSCAQPDTQPCAQPDSQSLSQDNVNYQNEVCFYCEEDRKNHIYIPNHDFRKYRIRPMKSDKIWTKVYEYEVNIWDPGFGDIQEMCRVYYSPACRKCVRLMETREGKECSKM